MQAHAPAALPEASSPTGLSTQGGAVGSAIATSTEVEAPALRIVGLTGDGDRLVCAPAQPFDAATVRGTADTTTDPAEPRYTLAIDDRLRAAVSGNLDSAAKGEIDMTPGLRPREIQSRIRAGANVEQVAAAAGCAVERIEGFAYPVLQERAAVAERARAAQPLKGTTGTLEEIVTDTLANRGQLGHIEWDAFKDERGWTVTLTWQAGRSENRAEWAFSSRSGGGAIAARNAEATDLLEPGRTQLRPVDEGRARHDRASHDATHGEPAGTVHGRATASGESADSSRADDPVPQHTPSGTSTVTPDSEGAVPPAAGAAATPPARTSRRGHRPQMPSWEDVLLGTRTAEH